MGFGTTSSKSGEEFKRVKLSEDLQRKVEETFKVFDNDDSKEIDVDEMKKHWKGKFAQLSANEFLKQVDFDNSGTIDSDEFMRFWEIAKAYGVGEDEISEELENIQKGETWAGFS